MSYSKCETHSAVAGWQLSVVHWAIATWRDVFSQLLVRLQGDKCSVLQFTEVYRFNCLQCVCTAV